MKTIFDKDSNSKKKESVVVYMRYSSNNQDETSIQYQRSATMTYAYQKGYFIAAEYIDEAKTGTNDRREGFQELIKNANNKPEWRKILVYDYSRFSRNNSDFIKHIEDLEDLGIEVISVTQAFDDSPEGFLMKGIVGLLNDYYSRNLARYAHAGLKQKAKDAKHCGGIPPLGFNIGEDETLIIDPYEADEVRLIFDLFETNYSYIKMAEELNKRGYRTKTGKEFCKNSFNSILTQEKYIGTYSWNKRKKKNSKGHRNSHKYKPEEEQVRMKDGCPSIIDKEQFYRVQDILKERKKGTAQSKSRHFYLLGGIHKLKCAECGAYLVGTTRKSHNKEYKYYYCPNHKKHNCSTKEIRADYLDKFIANAVTNDIYKRQDLINLFNNTDEKGKIKVHKARLQGLEQSTRNILKSLRKEQSDELRAELKRISEEKQQIQAEIDKICTGQRTMTEDNKAEICKELAKKIVNGQSYEVKKYLKTAIDSIIVSNDDVKLTLNIA